MQRLCVSRSQVNLALYGDDFVSTQIRVVAISETTPVLRTFTTDADFVQAFARYRPSWKEIAHEDFGDVRHVYEERHSGAAHLVNLREDDEGPDAGCRLFMDIQHAGEQIRCPELENLFNTRHTVVFVDDSGVSQLSDRAFRKVPTVVPCSKAVATFAGN